MVSGVVRNAEQHPIENARVELKAWVYDMRIFESRAVEQTVLSNAEGYFTLTFAKAEALDVVAWAKGFDARHISYTLKGNKLTLNLVLDPAPENRFTNGGAKHCLSH